MGAVAEDIRYFSAAFEVLDAGDAHQIVPACQRGAEIVLALRGGVLIAAPQGPGDEAAAGLAGPGGAQKVGVCALLAGDEIVVVGAAGAAGRPSVGAIRAEDA